ncbi:MAG: ATP-binding cassette domain-containing protein [Treponema sp.]|nr:ATP-binding cassette domain-containing protein [Treponema sp.]
MNLISIKNCRIEDSAQARIKNFSWSMQEGQAWLAIGPNGGGKADFLKALCGQLKIVPNADGLYSNLFDGSVEIVSLEKAAALIQEERANDESEFLDGGVDHGRTARVFFAEALLNKKIKRDSKTGVYDLPPFAARLESDPQVKLCGVEKILDRGLKYMSTGEIRRTLLCRALLSQKKLLILSDPFAGLDAQSRKILLDFFDSVAKRQLAQTENAADKKRTQDQKAATFDFPRIILGMERFNEIPDAINKVVEWTGGAISFCGARADYEKVLADKNAAALKERKTKLANFMAQLNLANEQSAVLQNAAAPDNSVPAKSAAATEPALIEMRDVNVGWGDNKVLVNLNWTLRKNEHWLIRGPNGSGKTTFLELITGDNMQVFSNDIKIFGARRGSGETIWDIKKKLGIVSYRLHVEYRMVGASLLAVIVSGFKDSIGLYEQATDVEVAAAKKWLALGGFAGRENESFNNLSYGEQRAILILRAVVKAPQILILDEPCHGLDESFRQKILDLLALIAQSGTTTLLHVTHDPTEALAAEKHILEFHPGESPMYAIIEL